MRPSSAKDIFIIHTKGDRRQTSVYESLLEWSAVVGLTIVEYTDWEWAPANDPGPDFFGRMPEDPWLYMPEINTEKLQYFWRNCDVIVVLESDPTEKHGHGVAVELDEIKRRNPSGPPPAVIVAASFGAHPSEAIRPYISEFISLGSTEEENLRWLIAVAWLVSRLQRSGREGMALLDAADLRDRYLNRFVWFGPFWSELPLERLMLYPSVESWLPAARRLHGYMSQHSKGELAEAWNALAETLRL